MPCARLSQKRTHTAQTGGSTGRKKTGGGRGNRETRTDWQLLKSVIGCYHSTLPKSETGSNLESFLLKPYILLGDGVGSQGRTNLLYLSELLPRFWNIVAFGKKGGRRVRVSEVTSLAWWKNFCIVIRVVRDRYPAVPVFLF